MIKQFKAAAFLASLALLMPAVSSARPAYRVDKVVMLIRHGIRAPLDGEAAAAPYAASTFAAWNTPPSQLTPHGAQALRLLARFERARLMAQGLIPTQGCPQTGSIAIWTNSVSRTIASGAALADGLAPGCGLPVDHRPEGQADPFFDALEAGAVPFNAVEAAASINAELDGGRSLMRGAEGGFATMARVLGCDAARPCDFAAMPNRIAPSSDGKGITLSGAINITSGTAQVFLLQYAEGLPGAQVGWGRANLRDITAMSTLHARLFDVFARSHYMAPRVGGPIAREIVNNLISSDGPRLRLFVGHDNTIAAVTALLGTHFRLPGYGYDDPPIGGGILLERLTNRQNGAQRIRLFYLAQTPDQARNLADLRKSKASPLHSLPMPACGKICTPRRFEALIKSQLLRVEGRVAWRCCTKGLWAAAAPKRWASCDGF